MYVCGQSLHLLLCVNPTALSAACYTYDVVAKDVDRQSFQP